MTPNQVLGLVNIAAAALLAGVSLPLYLRKVGRNHLYGVRLRKSFESEENWYEINAFGGKQLALWSVPIALAGVLCLFVSFEHRPTLAAFLAVGPLAISVGIAVTKTVLFAKRL